MAINTLREIVRNNRFTPADLPTFEAKLFFEGSQQREYLVRFSVLLFLSAVIATAGVIGDSTATVIGAMIIAPLMTPIMATTAALLTGHFGRAVRSSLLVLAAVCGVILLSWFIGGFYLNAGRIVSFATNSQITGRTSPTGVDLVAALAAGAAGAFAMSRDDIADSLAGVAISISLVPPLCVVGVALAGGEWADAFGAMLLFLTNYLSILLAGGGLLGLLGLDRAARRKIDGRARRNAYILIGVATLIVAIPLIVMGSRLATQSYDQQQTKLITTNWLDGSPYSLDDLNIDFVSSRIELSITGSGPAPTLDELGPRLEALFSKPIEIDLKVIPADRQVYPIVSTDESP